jgi:hypothetical protein
MSDFLIKIENSEEVIYAHKMILEISSECKYLNLKKRFQNFV